MIQFADDELKFDRLSEEEARLAARYAVNELNGFAPWLQSLAEHHPAAVKHVLTECIAGEWKFAPDRKLPLEVVHDLVYYGDGLAALVEDVLVAQFRERDPVNYQILEHSLRVLLSRIDQTRDVLAELSAQRIRNYAPDNPAFCLWLSIWMQLDAIPAIQFLFDLTERGQEAPDNFVERVCNVLSEEPGQRPLVPNPDFLRPACLRKLIPFLYQHVHMSEDIDRSGGGPYSPTARDHAQRFRDGLLSLLARIETAGAEIVLRELADEPVLAKVRDWILHLAEKNAEVRADLPPWDAQDIRTFAKEHETDPKMGADLFRIACKRFEAIRYDVEKAENSRRQDLHRDDDEARLRRWLASELSRRSCGRYTVPQEAEIDLQQCPDLRIENPQIPAAVSIEVKWADNWSLADLLERLQNQLVGQYLRAHNASHGIYVLGNIGNKQYWIDPKDQRHLNFSKLRPKKLSPHGKMSPVSL